MRSYTPVTDAMLRNPPASDWLMIRHDYKATNYSALNQITAQNAGNLRLAWVWAMNTGTNQPAPVVHDGTMFLNNAGNYVQALNAATGDLIWENRVGTAGGGSQRGMALFEDKVYVTTGEGKIWALDARTGRDIWNAQLADKDGRTHGTSSGPLAVKGMLIQGMGAARATRKRNASSARGTPGPARKFGAPIPSPNRASRAATPGARCRICSAPAARPGSRAATIRI